MTEIRARDALRRYWPVALAVLAVGIGIAVPLLDGDGEGGSEVAGASRRAPLVPEEVPPGELPERGNPPRKSPEEQTREIIAAHREKVEQAPESEDAPVLLLAMGNLYRQKLLDYENAAQCYIWLIGDYPDAPNITSAYINLGVCYEQLGQQDKANRLYREMSEKFPEDTVEHQFAQQKLHEH